MYGLRGWLGCWVVELLQVRMPQNFLNRDSLLWIELKHLANQIDGQVICIR